MANAIVLASGGLDSTVLSYYLKRERKIEKLKLVFIDYGQKCLKEEFFCVKNLAKNLNAEIKVIDAKWLGRISTSLINKNANKKEIKDIPKEKEIISWYVPCRNAIFLLVGLAVAESEFISKEEKYEVYIGIKHEGKLSFRDTTPEFLEQMNNLVGFCTQKGDFRFIAPFLEKDKEEIIELAEELKVPLEKTYSCYIGRGLKKLDNKHFMVHCGICGACKERKKAFRFSNKTDQTIYKS